MVRTDPRLQCGRREARPSKLVMSSRTPETLPLNRVKWPLRAVAAHLHAEIDDRISEGTTPPIGWHGGEFPQPPFGFGCRGGADALVTALRWDIEGFHSDDRGHVPGLALPPDHIDVGPGEPAEFGNQPTRRDLLRATAETSPGKATTRSTRPYRPRPRMRGAGGPGGHARRRRPTPEAIADRRAAARERFLPPPRRRY